MSIDAALAAARTDLSQSNYRAALTWLCTHPAYRTAAIQRFFPPTISSGNTRGFVSKIGPARELAWSVALMYPFSAALNEIASQIDRYEAALLASDHVTCLAVLNSLDSEYGQSLFSIEQHIAVLQLSSGLQAQKDYLTKLRSQSKTTSFLGLIAIYASERNERTLPASRFSARFANLISSANIPDDYKRYLLFRVLSQPASNPRDLESVLRIEQQATLLDIYDTTLRLLFHLAADSSSPLHAHALRHLADLSSVLADVRLARALSITNGDLPTFCDDSELQAALLRGNWEEACTSARYMASSNPQHSILEAYAVASTIADIEPSEDKPLVSSILKGFHSLTSLSQDFEEQSDRLQQLRLNHASLGFADTIGDLLDRHLSNEPIPKSRSLAVSNLLARAITRQELLASPIHSLLDTNSDAKRLTAEYANLRRVEAGTQQIPTSLYAPFYQLAVAERSYAEADYLGVLTVTEALKKELPYFSRRALRLEVHALLSLEKRAEAISAIVSQFLVDPQSIKLLPLQAAASALRDKHARRKVAGHLSASILLDIYTKIIAGDLRTYRGYAYDEFLRAHAMSRPSELASRIGDFPRSELLYYLRYVCIPANMQSSYTFQSIKEIEDERISVCSLLATIDITNRDIYIAEAVEIGRDQTIREAMRTAEQSKIFIDVPALKAWADRDLADSFARFKSLSTFDYANSIAELLADLAAILQTERNKLDNFLVLQQMSDESALLATIINQIVNAALKSSEFGLDSYLSTRIRHGILSGQLRTALVDQKLITQRVASNQPYANNEYWLGKFANRPAATRDTVAGLLNAFSQEFDNLVDRFIQQHIQLDQPDKPAALFSSRISNIATQQIINKVVAETTFDEFVDLVLEAVYQEAELALSRVHDIIDTELRPTIFEMLSTLDSEVSKALSNEGTGEFEWAVKSARTETDHQLDRIRNWFRLRQASPEPTFSLDHIIESNIRTIKTLHRDFTLEVVKDDVPNVWFSGALTRFSDIFFQLFENVWQHSGIRAKSSVRIEASYKDGHLRLHFESNVAPNVPRDNAIAALAKTMEEIKSSDYRGATRTEGRTGLKKIFRSMNQAQRETPTIEARFSDHNTFIVDMSFEIQEAERAADLIS